MQGKKTKIFIQNIVLNGNMIILLAFLNLMSLSRPVFRGGPGWAISPSGGTCGAVNFHELFFIIKPT